MVLKFNTGRLKLSEYVFNQTLDLSVLNQTADTTSRIIIPAAEITDKVGTQIKVTLETWGGANYPKLYIGKQASSGNDWDFDGNQVQLLFGGSPTISGENVFVSDWVDLDTDGTDDMILSVYNSASGTSHPKSTTSGAGVVWGVVGDSAADTAPAGYGGPSAFLMLIGKISIQ